MKTPAWLKDISKSLSGFFNKGAAIDPGLQISEMFLGFLLLIPAVLGLFYILWSLHPLFALFVEFAAMATILLLALKIFDNALKHS